MTRHVYTVSIVSNINFFGADRHDSRRLTPCEPGFTSAYERIGLGLPQRLTQFHYVHEVQVQVQFHYIYEELAAVRVLVRWTLRKVCGFTKSKLKALVAIVGTRLNYFIVSTWTRGLLSEQLNEMCTFCLPLTNCVYPYNGVDIVSET